MKSADTQMIRLERELAAIYDARATMDYLGYSPQNDTWKKHCAALGRELDRTLAKHIDH